jgi:hypothetical protein
MLMSENENQPTGHARHIARRAFIKRAALGAVFAVPVMDSITKSEILIKSALAATVPNLTITAGVSPQSQAPGTVTPGAQTVAPGGDALITVTPGGVDTTWIAYSVDGAALTTTTAGEQATGTFTFHHVTGNHDLKVVFIPTPGV